MNKYVSPSLEIMDMEVVNVIMASTDADDTTVFDCGNQLPLAPAAV